MLKQKFLEFGYTEEEYNLIRNSHGISTYTDTTLTKQFINITSYLLDLGYTKAEVLKMTKSLPALYSLSIENMKQKISDIIDLGYTREEVIKMTISLPAIYGYSIENIIEKIEFYDSINMHKLAVVAPKQLMQSVALSYARYNFYLSVGIEINMVNYKKLFIDNKQFEKSYGKTKQEILEEYNYEKYMEKKKNGRTL